MCGEGPITFGGCVISPPRRCIISSFTTESDRLNGGAMNTLCYTKGLHTLYTTPNEQTPELTNW